MFNGLAMDIELVVWVDSQTEQSWEPISALVLPTEYTQSVGFVIKETDKFLVIAGSFDNETDSSNSRIVIPKESIKERHSLKELDFASRSSTDVHNRD